jgi:hypothetical protein
MKAVPVIAGSLALAVVVLACHSSDAVAPAPTANCTLSGLSGAFGFQRNGQSAPGAPISSVGVATFDGHGNMAAQEQVSNSGVFSVIAGETGTYTINPDCTGTLSGASGSVIASLSLVHGGDEVLGISSVAGTNISMHYERIPGPCTNAILKGTYGFQRNGIAAGGVQLLALGTAVFDGIGTSNGVETNDRNGKSNAVNVLATYVINADCTGTMSDTTRSVFSQMVVVGGGDEILGISMTAGNNVVIHFERVAPD